MGIYQLSNHVVQTEEQMTHWDMLNKATKSEFSLSVAVFAAFRSFDAYISEANGSFSIVLTEGSVYMQL